MVGFPFLAFPKSGSLLRDNGILNSLSFSSTERVLPEERYPRRSGPWQSLDFWISVFTEAYPRREIESLKDTVDLAGVFGADHNIRQTVIGFVVFQHRSRGRTYFFASSQNF
jgi:hypothetical protein